MIAVDWGNTSLRLYRLDDAGDIRERRRSERGAMTCGGDFRRVLEEEIEGWDDTLVLMCGMVGGRGGWMEMPYLDCPIGGDALARGMQRLSDDAFPGRELWIIPGLRDMASDSVPDVIRSEETQLLALLQALPGGTHLACLPGTHSKWVTLRDGRIERITTAMTGELYALLRRHSSLGSLMLPEEAGRFDAYAFDAGLARSAEAGGLLHHLFGVRTTALLGQQAEAALPSYLSGLLIGHELRASGVFTQKPRPAQVHLVGSDRLLTAYAHALTTLGVGVQRHPENLAARGMQVLWSLRAQLR